MEGSFPVTDSCPKKSLLEGPSTQLPKQSRFFDLLRIYALYTFSDITTAKGRNSNAEIDTLQKSFSEKR